MEGVTDRELNLRRRLRAEFSYYAPRCLSIRTKEGRVAALKLNRAQEYIHTRLEAQRISTGRVRALILKGRQQGCSTYVGARFYHQTTHRKGVRSFILTHEDAATQNLFEMVNRYHEHCNPLVKPSTGAANAKELFFDRLDSGYKVGTAGTRGVGRSSTIQLFHGSEVAFWPNAESHAAGVLQAVPDTAGTEVILESTANGVGNFFYDKWKDAEIGKGDFIGIFVPWFWQDEYRKAIGPDFVLDEEERDYASQYQVDLEQMAWRRNKIAELKDASLFKQEYPACILAGMRVGTGRGIIPIEEVRVGDFLATGCVSAVMPNGVRDVVKVRTSRGYEVTCTPDHRLQLEDGEWVEAGQAQGKRLMLIPPKFGVSNEVVRWRPVPCVEAKVEVDERFGRLLGYFMGDGCWYDDTLSICCDAKDTDVIEDVRALLAENVGEPTSRLVGSKKGGLELRIGLKRFADVLSALGVIRPEKPHRVVKVPDCIWRSPKAVVREFLRGLFESDGFCNMASGRVSLFSKHVEFLRDVQLLLLGFGITSRAASRPTTNGQGYSYTAHTLDLRKLETAAFIARVGFVSARKGQQIAPVVSKVGRQAAPMLLSDEVLSIKPAGQGEVYDLTVPGQHRFDANGISAHNCAAEAFQISGHDGLIRPELIVRARKNNVSNTYGPLVIGFDPAWTGGDRHAMAWRRGRKLLRLEARTHLDTMQSAGWCKQVIDKDNPRRFFVDVGGVGAGVYDRLCEMGYARIVRAVNFGSSPMEPGGVDGGGPLNRRAEIWMKSRDWLEDPAGVDIPDDDALQADACGPGYRYDSNTRLVLEKKEDMRKRGVPSPDLWDAVALTFAEAVPPAFEDQPGNDAYERSDSGRGGGNDWMAA